MYMINMPGNKNAGQALMDQLIKKEYEEDVKLQAATSVINLLGHPTFSMMLLLTGVGLNNTAAMAQSALLPHRPSAMQGEVHLWPLKNSWTNKNNSCNDGNGYIYIYKS